MMNESYFYHVVQEQNRKIERLEKMVSDLTSGYRMDMDRYDDFIVDVGCEDVYSSSFPAQISVTFNTLYSPLQEIVFFNGNLLNEEDYWVSGNHYTIEKGGDVDGRVPIKLVVIRICRKDPNVQSSDQFFRQAVLNVEGQFAEEAAEELGKEKEKNRINSLEI